MNALSQVDPVHVNRQNLLRVVMSMNSFCESHLIQVPSKRIPAQFHSGRKPHRIHRPGVFASQNHIKGCANRIPRLNVTFGSNYSVGQVLTELCSRNNMRDSLTAVRGSQPYFSAGSWIVSIEFAEGR